MDSNDNRGPQLVAVSTAFLCITILSIGVRIYTRLRLVKWVGADDVLILCAAIFAGIMYTGTVISCQYGLGRHTVDQPVAWREPYVKSDLTSSLSYSASAMFVKLSLLAFYIRISPNRTFRLVTYILLFVSAGFGVGSIFATGFQCIPISMLWDATQPGHCFNIHAFYFANAGLHILTELLIYVLPIRTLWKLQLPFKQKLGLYGLMAIGAMLIVISCYRLATLRDLLGSTDLTWHIATPLMWYTIEINLAIFVACGPAFLAFFRHYIPVIFGSSSNQTRYHPSHPKNSYPLGSISHMAPQTDNGIKTTVTTRSPYFEDNSSEEMIIMPTGIQKQVDVWVENEDLEAGSRSELSTAVRRVIV